MRDVTESAESAHSCYAVRRYSYSSFNLLAVPLLAVPILVAPLLVVPILALPVLAVHGCSGYFINSKAFWSLKSALRVSSGDGSGPGEGTRGARGCSVGGQLLGVESDVAASGSGTHASRGCGECMGRFCVR